MRLLLRRYRITTGKPQKLYLDEKDRSLIAGKHVLILDDVISTGSTLQGMRLVIEKAGGKVAGESAILTEGDRAEWMRNHLARSFGASILRLVFLNFTGPIKCLFGLGSSMALEEESCHVGLPWLLCLRSG